MRLRANSWKSALTTGINNSVTTIDGLDMGGFNLPTIGSPDYMVIIIDPQATEGLPEIVHLTAYTSGNPSGTVVRGAEGSTALTHSAGVEIVVGPTMADFDSILAFVQQWPVSHTQFDAPSATLSDVDASLEITFVAPESGNVVVELGAYARGNPGDSACFWGIREGGSVIVANTFIAVFEAPCLTHWLVTGLTPGSSHTYKWAAAASYTGGPSVTGWGGDWGPATMSVTAAP